MLRMNTPESEACAFMRTRSPRTAPPVNGLVGSTANTPIEYPSARRWAVRRSTASSGEQLPCDHEALNLARAFSNGGELDVAEELLGRIVLHETVAAMNLDAVVSRLHGDLAGIQFRHRGLERRAVAAILEISSPVGQK